MTRRFWLDHPRGLFICFGTELWERFSYYGMRALLIYYLTQHFLFSDDESFAIYGAYTALAWGLPVIGGVIADRYLGSRKAVTVGAVLLSAGHLLLTVEGPPSLENLASDAMLVERHPGFLNLFYLSLALIVSGVGFMKTNISTVVGALYDRDDPRRDAGFTIFYLGINIGAAIAPLACGWLGQTYGWRYGFGFAGIGMLVGLLLFLSGQRYLMDRADPPDPDRLSQLLIPGINVERLTYIGAAIMVLLAWQMLQRREIVGILLTVLGIGLPIWMLYFSVFRCSKVERDRLLVVCILVVFSILFWSMFEQLGSSLNLFSDRLVDRRVLGWDVHASQLQSVPPILVIGLAPVFSILWTILETRGANPSFPVKFAIAITLLGFAFLIPSIGYVLGGENNLLGLTWLIAMFCLMVCAELCCSPIALNMITRLCPARVVGTMMGAYFLSISIGSFVAGQLAKATSLPKQVDSADIGFAMEIYLSSFSRIGYVAIGAGVLLFLLSPFLRARMHGSHKYAVESKG